jgi:glucokinase
MILDPDEIRQALGDVPVLLFNDMVGQGHGLAQVPQDALRPLAGPAQADGTRLVVNIGTGLNACPVHQAGGGTFVPVAEAGNVTLPQVDAPLRALACALGGEVVAEDVISGRGLPVLAAQLAGRDGCSAAEALGLAEVRDAVFVALAAYLRDMVLTHMATGGVYLTGSVSAALADRLDWQELHRAMIGQRAYTDVLARVPVVLVRDPLVTLRGAAQLAARTG